jgi:hypothetical protein
MTDGSNMSLEVDANIDAMLRFGKGSVDAGLMSARETMQMLIQRLLRQF